MLKEYYVYLHARPNGQFYYVGKGSGNRSHDFIKNRNKHHLRITKKIGVENVVVSIFPCADEAHAFEMEILIIDVLRKSGFNLANLTDGGDGVRGYVFTVEAKKKMSDAQKGKILPPEQRAKMAAARTGLKRSAETKLKQSAASIGRKKSPEACRNMSEAHKGLPWSQKRRELFERKKNEK